MSLFSMLGRPPSTMPSMVPFTTLLPPLSIMLPPPPLSKSPPPPPPQPPLLLLLLLAVVVLVLAQPLFSPGLRLPLTRLARLARRSTVLPVPRLMLPWRGATSSPITTPTTPRI